MAPRRQNRKNAECVKLPQEEKLLLQQRVADFVASGNNELALPGLSNLHRKYIHQYAAELDLKTRSYGKGKNRELHIMKNSKMAASCPARPLQIAASTQQMMQKLTPAVKESLASCVEYSADPSYFMQMRLRGEALLLGLGPRMVPPRANRINNDLYRDKMELPIYHYKDEICRMLQSSSIFIVSGETGSGKTTQIPQYILSEANRWNRPCRILVTQPRRMAAVTVAQRVAEERGELIGDTVGFQIRMESCLRKTTNLIYTTSGCFLRSIMVDVADLFRKVTHLIIDEIHERDKSTDFTLITIKEQLKYNKDIKVILMSATMDINLLSKYFNDCPVLKVPGQSYDVKIYHLEDILYHTGYRTLLMEKYLRMAKHDNKPSQSLNANEMIRTTPVLIADNYVQEVVDHNIDFCCNNSYKTAEELWEVFDQLQYYIESEGVPVDGGHSQTGITPLIAACISNCPKYVNIFLQLQASVHILDTSGRSAADYAAEHTDGACLQVLLGSSNLSQQHVQQAQKNLVELEKDRLMSAYRHQFNMENDVDHDLILSLLEGLYRSVHPGAIMVFLPGYSDIVVQRDLITSTLPAGTFKVYILHGQMDPVDQWQALQTLSVRKIILSTNIGQTSITIPDLAYIIDSGKVKMKMYDTLTESSQLQSVWISKADAHQRSGRAGRTQNGVCYRLYSSDRYNFMSKFCIPEFLRIPLTEICLYAKTLDKDVSVKTYLSRALNPPSTMSVQNAVKKLQILEIFNEDESVTDLGRHLVDIPVDVQLGKCLIYSIFLKCVDPVLSIVAFHSVKDPFILPNDRAQQGYASFQRKSFAGQSFSDHRGIVALYDAYTSIRNLKKKHDFCTKYFLSQSAMDVFCATRRQILDLATKKFRLGVNATIFNSDWNLVRYCLVAGFYPNVAVIDRPKMTLSSGVEKDLVMQRTSAVNPPGMKSLKEYADTLPHDWIVFYEKSRMHTVRSINMNTVVPPLLIALQCGQDAALEEDYCETDEESGGETPTILAEGADAVGEQEPHVVLAIDSWIKFELPAAEAKAILSLRQLLHNKFWQFLQNGHSNKTMEAVIYLQKLLSTVREEEKKNTDNSNSGGRPAEEP